MTRSDVDHPEYDFWLVENCVSKEATVVLLRCLASEDFRVHHWLQWRSDRCNPGGAYSGELDRKIINEVSNQLEDRIGR